MLVSIRQTKFKTHPQREVIGIAPSAPEVGKRFAVQEDLHTGLVTSVIETVRELGGGGYEIDTRNSTYRILPLV